MTETQCGMGAMVWLCFALQAVPIVVVLAAIAGTAPAWARWGCLIAAATLTSRVSRLADPGAADVAVLGLAIGLAIELLARARSRRMPENEALRRDGPYRDVAIERAMVLAERDRTERRAALVGHAARWAVRITRSAIAIALLRVGWIVLGW